MKKEDLIIKWLDNSLNEEELKAFKQLDASSAFMKIDEAAQQFKAPDFDVEAHLAKLPLEKKTKVVTPSWKRYITGIAAAAVVSLGLYFAFFNGVDTTFIAQNAQKTEFVLPDASAVILNANSQISFDESNWGKQRKLKLDGEAYFKVTKGNKFSVETPQGIVSVLGTQFIVNSRASYFEVTCFEGLVQVDYKGGSIKIAAGNTFKIYNSKVVSEKTNLLAPTWIHAKSSFKSVPFAEVLDEIARQYDVTINYNEAIRETVFTGSFTHENLQTALEAITIPLNLSFDIKGNHVVLKSN